MHYDVEGLCGMKGHLLKVTKVTKWRWQMDGFGLRAGAVEREILHFA
jgi:hypothetical protein